MTLLYIEGFEGASASTGTSSEDDTEAYLDARYTTPTWNSHGPQVYAGWGGIGNACTMGDNGSASANYIRFELAETQTTVIGFALKAHVGVNATLAQRILSFRHVADGKEHVVVNLIAGTHLEFESNSVVIGGVSNIGLPGYWSYVEVKVLISATVGTIDVQLNGVNVLSLTGLDTRNAGSGDDIDAIDLNGVDGTSAAADKVVLFDDVYVLDTAGSSPTNDFLGPTKVEEILPDGTGDNADWTASGGGNNYLKVDETPRDDDTTYNESSTSTNLDLFNASSLAQIDGTIYGVQIDALGRITDATTYTLIPTVKSVATEAADGSTLVTDQVNYVAVLGMFELDPDAAAAWTATTVNAMQIGYEVG